MKALKIIAVLLVATFLYYKFAYPSYTYRYRMTLEIDTPEGLKSGSSVVEIHTTQWPEFLRGLFGGHISNTKSRGESVLIEMPDGKTLFTVNRGQEDQYLLAYSFPMRDVTQMSLEEIKNYAFSSNKTHEGIKYYGTLKDAKGVVPEYALPQLVYFTDIDDPQTVKEIDYKNLENYFGQEVKFKRAFIETTDKPLEWKMDSRLNWLKEYYHSKLGLDGKGWVDKDIKNKFAHDLHSGSFSWGKRDSEK